jgi:hypothetical protein
MVSQQHTEFRDKVVADSLLSAYGPLVGGDTLIKLLGYSSGEAFRQAQHRGTVPIDVFTIPNRKGKFAFTNDLIRWLMDLRKEKAP